MTSKNQWRVIFILHGYGKLPASLRQFLGVHAKSIFKFFSDVGSWLSASRGTQHPVLMIIRPLMAFSSPVGKQPDSEVLGESEHSAQEATIMEIIWRALFWRHLLWFSSSPGPRPHDLLTPLESWFPHHHDTARHPGPGFWMPALRPASNRTEKSIHGLKSTPWAQDIQTQGHRWGRLWSLVHAFFPSSLVPKAWVNLFCYPQIRKL